MDRVIKMLGMAVLLLLGGGTLIAGNLQIRDHVKVVSVDDNFFTLSLSLSWDNSWYDDYNFDAVWLFLKYRTPDMAEWTPVFLGTDGHEVGSNGEYLPGDSGSENVGLFVWSKSNDAGRVELNCKIKCAIPYGCSRADVEQNRLYFAVQGIEMVYVPAGAFYLGDGASEGSFQGTAVAKPVLVDSENSLTLSDAKGNTYTLEADYPKGYNGFFCMKTEISQKQYVDFLNLLTLTQQYGRVTNLMGNAMREGYYIFSGSATPASRNGIRLKKKSTARTVPCIFINDLNGDGEDGGNEDGQALPCGYLSAEDIYAYCCWAGLRPLSEPEFEKACRKLFPVQPVAGEYPWNTADGAGAITDAEVNGKNSLAENVTALGKNVNAAGLRSDPVRGGAFSGNMAMSAGATFWGIRQMGGNLRECCISAEMSDMTALCGNGYAEGAPWTGAVARGGGFNSPLTQLCVSDRSEADFIDETAHEADFGGRGCRSVVAGSPGRISGANGKDCDTVCMGENGQVMSVALPDRSGETTYRWVMREGGTEVWKELRGEYNAALTYEPDTRVVGTSRFFFRRIAHSNRGDLLSNEVELVFINNNLQLSRLRDTVDKCGEAGVIEATHYQSGTIAWSAGGRVLASESRVRGMSFIPDRTLGAANAETLLICQSVMDGCSQTQTIPVFIADEAADPSHECWACGDNVTDADGNVYTTVAMPDGRCWMEQNMKVNVPGSYVYDGADENVYGRLYTWTAAMGGKDFEGAQGICPAGWQIPTYAEWQQLISALGGASGAGAILQNSGLKLPLSGGRNAGSYSFSGLNIRGDYWSSTLTGNTALGITVENGRNNTAEYNGDLESAISVRCVKK